MKIQISKSDLSKVLGLAYRAIPAKTATAILENFLLEFEDGDLRVTASDMELSIIAKTHCEGENGRACVPANTLVNLVKTLPEGVVTLTEADSLVTVDWGKGKSNFPSFDVRDYPEIQKASTEWTSCSTEALRKGLKHVLPNVSDDALRPALSGVFFNPKEGVIDLVASDSHTLAVYPVEGTVAESFILPAKTAAYVKDNLSGESTGIRIEGTLANFDLNGVEVYSRTIIGKFPKYESVMPQNNGFELSGKISDLKEAVTRISSCANKASKFVKLSLCALGSTIEGQDLGFNCSAKETLDTMVYNGDNIEIGFRFDLLLTLLSVFDGTEIKMSFADGRHAALVECEGDPCQAIIMPVQIM